MGTTNLTRAIRKTPWQIEQERKSLAEAEEDLYLEAQLFPLLSEKELEEYSAQKEARDGRSMFINATTSIF